MRTRKLDRNLSPQKKKNAKSTEVCRPSGSQHFDLFHPHLLVGPTTSQQRFPFSVVGWTSSNDLDANIHNFRGWTLFSILEQGKLSQTAMDEGESVPQNPGFLDVRTINSSWETPFLQRDVFFLGWLLRDEVAGNPMMNGHIEINESQGLQRMR